MEITDYWRILRRHWLAVLAITAAVVLAAAAFTMAQPRVYSADAAGFVSSGPSDNPALSSLNDQLAKSRATSYVDIAKSRATAEAVIDELGLDVTPASLVGRISVNQPRETVLLKVAATGDTPEAAQQLADAWIRAVAGQVAEIEDPKGTGAAGVPRVQPVESAALPTAPSSPNVRMNLALGLLLGALLGLGYALLRHTFDRRLRTKEDIEGRFAVSVVGAVPEAPALARAAQGADLDGPDPIEVAGPAAEAFRKLRTNLTYMNVDNPPRVVVVTSPMPGDGKSTVAAHLAAAIATSGQPAVLLDADLRRPTVATRFALDDGIGLSDVLAGRIPIDEALQEPLANPGLRVLAAGPVPPNPSELLGSNTMRQLLRDLAGAAIVVIDAPPLLPVTDAAILAAQSDGAFVVVSAGRTLDAQLASALDHLAAVDARALGVVLNRISRRDAGSGYYARYDGYHAREDSPSPSPRAR